MYYALDRKGFRKQVVMSLLRLFDATYQKMFSTVLNSIISHTIVAKVIYVHLVTTLIPSTF